MGSSGYDWLFTTFAQRVYGNTVLANGCWIFYSYMDRFGFSQLTGVDMAGEAEGRLKVPGDLDWYPVDLATNSF